MKLVSQKRLSFREGNSDKVYEVDLCEVGPGRFVVNYRYGRRGSNLREGTETVQPVPEAEAQRIFTKLVESKTRKGYQEVLSGQAPAGPKPSPLQPQGTPPPQPQSLDPRARSIVERLNQAVDHLNGKGGAAAPAATKPKHRPRRTRHSWPLPRLIYRAGVLRIREATPALVGLLASTEPMHLYCAAWSLGQCAEPGDPEVLRPLLELSLKIPKSATGTYAATRRILGEALRKLRGGVPGKDLSDLYNLLPQELAGLCRKGPSADLAETLTRHLDGESPTRYEVLETLYQIDTEHTRFAILSALAKVPLRPPAFVHLRHLFKAAEYRRDSEVFGLLAYRIEKEAPMYVRTSNWGRHYSSSERGQFQERDKEAWLKQGLIAYGQATQLYLRRRTWRTLKRLAQTGDPDYVKMAVGVLLPFKEADAVPTIARYNTHWDSFAPYWAFNNILYGKSPRYKSHASSRRLLFRCANNYRPGGKDPTAREESYPALWDARPEGLLHLLSESACGKVHSFAVKALRTLPAVLQSFDRDVVLMLLSRRYEETAALGFSLVKKFYDPRNPDKELLLSLADSVHVPARKQAYTWINDDRTPFLADVDFLIQLLLSAQHDTRAFAKTLLSSSSLTETTAQTLTGRLIAHLLSMKETPSDQFRAKDIGDVLAKILGRHLRRVGDPVVLDLLHHPLEAVQELAANILMAQSDASALYRVPDAILRKLLASPFESVRSAGVLLFGKLPDEELLARGQTLLLLSTHTLADLRSAIRPVVKRLCARDAHLAREILDGLVAVLTKPEQVEGLHAHVVRLAKEDLVGSLSAMSLEAALQLVYGSENAAKELGGLVLLHNPHYADQMEIADMVRLASHEILAVRTASWGLLTQAVPRMHKTAEDLAQGVRFLDASWEDSRARAFTFFREHFDDRHLTPWVMIGICDSVRPDVQRFGRELITRFFDGRDGETYLLHLSEHPSVDLQLFATNYLERYAADNPERIAELVPYFQSVLCRVNKAGVAKKRIYSFLFDQALKTEAAARVIAELLTRVSATMAITDRARALETLVHIRRKYPFLPVPHVVRPPGLYDGQKGAKEAQAKGEGSHAV